MVISQIQAYYQTCRKRKSVGVLFDYSAGVDRIDNVFFDNASVMYPLGSMNAPMDFISIAIAFQQFYIQFQINITDSVIYILIIYIYYWFIKWKTKKYLLTSVV